MAESVRITTTERSASSPIATAGWTRAQTARAAILTAIAYSLGAHWGFTLPFGPTSVAVLWPPNAILLAALLLAPMSAWWMLVAAILPVHFLVELGSGVSLPMVLPWFVNNCIAALLGAALVRRFLPGRVRLDTVASFTVFLVCAGLIGSLLSSILDAGLVTSNGWIHSSYWTLWRVRFLSNLLAIQTIVPVVLGIDMDALRAIRRSTFRQRLEWVAMAAALPLTCVLAYWLPIEWSYGGPALLLAPFPLLLWAAVRFGPLGNSLAFATVTVLTVGGTSRGWGPFRTVDASDTAFSLQLFLLAAGIPLALLSRASAQRRRLECQAAERERMLSMTMKAAHVGVWKFDPSSGAFTADDVVMEMLGPPDEQRSSYMALIDTALERRPTASDERPSMPHDGGAPDQSGVVASADYPEQVIRIQHPDGSVRWVLVRLVRLCQPDGTPLRIMGVAMDLTERRLIEQALREDDERLSLVATAANMGFWSLELTSGEVWLSDQCYTMVGAERGGEEPRQLLERICCEPSLAEAVANLESGVLRTNTFERELRVRRPDGSDRWIASSARLQRDESGDPTRIIGVSHDVTEQRRAEHEANLGKLALSHLSRVATVGELTATIVHEVGQPIGAIALNAQSLDRLVRAPTIEVEELFGVALDLQRDAARARRVLGQLRDMLRRREETRERLDMEKVIRDALAMSRTELRALGIEVVINLPEGLPQVAANRTQIHQVLLNVILNARDAIQAADTERRRIIVTASSSPDGMLTIHVADTGGGIPEEHLPRVFEPFFTSKAEGLGLGLSISRTLMLEHGGDLRAENCDGGAVLHLSLPVAPGRPPVRAADAMYDGATAYAARQAVADA